MLALAATGSGEGGSGGAGREEDGLLALAATGSGEGERRREEDGLLALAATGSGGGSGGGSVVFSFDEPAGGSAEEAVEAAAVGEGNVPLFAFPAAIGFPPLA